MIKVQGDVSNDEEGEEAKDEAPKMNADEQADQQVEDFLSKFLIGSESTFLDNIDLVIMLKALPGKITKYNMHQISLFNFNILQSAIIAFLNEDIVNAFEFYDKKNRDRVSNVRDLIISQKDNLDKVQDLMNSVKD